MKDSEANAEKLHDHLNEIETAIDDLTVAIETDPDNAALYYRRGVLHGQLADPV